MAETYIQLPAPGSGEKLRSHEYVRGANTVNAHDFNIMDETGVRGATPLASDTTFLSDSAIVARMRYPANKQRTIINPRNVTSFDLVHCFVVGATITSTAATIATFTQVVDGVVTTGLTSLEPPAGKEMVIQSIWMQYVNGGTNPSGAMVYLLVNYAGGITSFNSDNILLAWNLANSQVASNVVVAGTVSQPVMFQPDGGLFIPEGTAFGFVADALTATGTHTLDISVLAYQYDTELN